MPPTVKRLVWLSVILLVGGFMVSNYFEKRSKEEAEATQARKLEETTRSAVAAMVARTNALDSWGTTLSNGMPDRVEPVLTVELQRLWLQGRPILFVGSVKDIAIRDDTYYDVLIKSSLWGRPQFITDVQLSLRGEREKVDSFLKDHPDLFGAYGFNNGVAVVAMIQTIRTDSIRDAAGDREDVKIGEGNLVEILYTGQTFF